MTCRVPDVESLPCRVGTHVLVNVIWFRESVTICERCRKTWADLDAEARR